MPVDLMLQRDETQASARPFGLGSLLLGLAGLFLSAAGVLLWWRHGAAVFTEYALSAMAWCF